MWMAFTTLTTVGYGDCCPVTAGGRVLCAVLVLTGMGLFSLFTAEFAAFILKEVKKTQK
jgi:Ion channel.